MARSKALVGLLGGSFDPPHLGHTLLAAYALGAHPLEQLFVIPAHKHADAKPLVPFEHRLRMCELAMQDLRRVHVSSIEQELGGVSRTLLTVTELQLRYPEASFALVVGSDLESELPTWYRYSELEALVTTISVGRAAAGMDRGLQGSRASRGSSSCSTVTLPAISSSGISARLGKRQPTSGLLSHSVAAYIEQHGLYRRPQG